MADELPQHPVQDGRLIDANLHLLDRQVLDRDGRPVLAVGDLEIEQRDEGRPVLTRLILGSGLTERFFGADRPRAVRHGVGWDVVIRVGTAIEVDVSRDDLDLLWLERWWRDRVIGRIPGGRHDPG